MKNRITLILKAQNRTQSQLAEDIGMKPPYLSYIVNGVHDPTLSTAAKIAKGLNMGVEDVFVFDEVVNQ